MSVPMNTIWRSKQPKQTQCQRCDLYYPESLAQCVHCSELDDIQLSAFKLAHHETLQDNSKLGSYLLFGAVIIGLLLLLSFL
jgi:hypothetical protein